MSHYSNDLAIAKGQLKRKVEALHAETHKPDTSTRVKIADQVIEAYVDATGERPDPYILGRLADYLLVDVLTDQYKHLRKDEHPIQSKNQVSKRVKRHNITTINDRQDV